MSSRGAPPVLFVFVKNGGRSRVAAGLLRAADRDTITADSAGAKPGSAVNALSAQVLLEVGVDITTQTPQAAAPEMVSAPDLVVTLGRDTHVDRVEGTWFENWDSDERSERVRVEVRVDADVAERHVTVVECRPPWPAGWDLSGHGSRSPGRATREPPGCDRCSGAIAT